MRKSGELYGSFWMCAQGCFAMSKICLGTAQFGMAYGVNNSRGMVSKDEVFSIVTAARHRGINMFDTAHAYGQSESVIGEYITEQHAECKIISKLPACGKAHVREFVRLTLERVQSRYLYGYLVHNFEVFKKDAGIWNELEACKRAGLIENLGFSLYYPSELEHILSSGFAFDMVQVPFNIFDRRFGPYFSELHRRRVAVFCRSVFLQGLVFKDPESLENYFAPIRDRLVEIRRISHEVRVPLFALCLNFATGHPSIDTVVVGVDSLRHFEEIVDADRFAETVEECRARCDELSFNDERITVPTYWPSIKDTVS
jgi:aryl-alcohol dehydrogenase-like predicted oxidoreductase